VLETCLTAIRAMSEVAFVRTRAVDCASTWRSRAQTCRPLCRRCGHRAQWQSKLFALKTARDFAHAVPPVRLFAARLARPYGSRPHGLGAAGRAVRSDPAARSIPSPGRRHDQKLPRSSSANRLARLPTSRLRARPLTEHLQLLYEDPCSPPWVSARKPYECGTPCDSGEYPQALVGSLLPSTDCVARMIGAFRETKTSIRAAGGRSA
jgi:hypothetical protein